MIKSTITFLILNFLFSCNNNSTKPISADKVNDQQIKNPDTTSLVHSKDTSQNGGTSVYVWVVDFENKTKKRNADFKKEYLNVDTLIKGLNQLHTNIKLDKIKISGDTLFTEIKDSYYLGERIGTYGANYYIADVVINLTSIKNINFVKIDFEDGSHISPGVWSSKDYKNYKVIR